MQNKKLYYEAPDDKIFEALKEKCIDIFMSFDDTYGYATEKANRIRSVQNVGDNFMYLISMLDTPNQIRLSEIVSEEVKKEILARLESVGVPDRYNNFK